MISKTKPLEEIVARAILEIKEFVNHKENSLQAINELSDDTWKIICKLTGYYSVNSLESWFRMYKEEQGEMDMVKQAVQNWSDGVLLSWYELWLFPEEIADNDIHESLKLIINNERKIDEINPSVKDFIDLLWAKLRTVFSTMEKEENWNKYTSPMFL